MNKIQSGALHGYKLRLPWCVLVVLRVMTCFFVVLRYIMQIQNLEDTSDHGCLISSPVPRPLLFEGPLWFAPFHLTVLFVSFRVETFQESYFLTFISFPCHLACAPSSSFMGASKFKNLIHNFTCTFPFLFSFHMCYYVSFVVRSIISFSHDLP